MKTLTNGTNGKMLGRTHIGCQRVCRCCLAPAWRMPVKRAAKRRERQAWKKNLSNI